MPIFFITTIVAASNLFLGFLTFSKNPKSITNRLFLSLTLILAFWAVANTLSVTVQGQDAIFFWIKIVMFITGAMFPTIYLLSSAYPNNTMELAKKWVFLTIFCILITQVLVILNQVFKGVELKDSSASPIPGPGIAFFAFNVLGFFTLSIVTLIKKFRQSTGRERIQLKYLILGIITTFVLTNLTNFVFVNLLHFTEFVAIGPVFTLILVGSISYAITKHRFLDISWVVARTVSYTLLVIFLGVIYALFFATLSGLLSGLAVSLKTVLISSSLALIMAFSFQQIRRLLEKTSDKVLYKNRYDESKLLYDLALIMSSTLLLEDLSHLILKQLLSQMRITKGALILTEKGHIYQVAQEGFSKKPELDEGEIVALFREKQTVIFEELPEDGLKNTMRSLELTIAVPLFSEGGEIGLLVLGEKLSGDIYNSEDIKVLEILSPEIAVAMQNAKSYEEIKRFNITLQEEVTLATQNLRIANDKLQELDKLKDDFVSVASHELRTPMTVIRSYSWMALHKSDVPLSEKLKRYLERTLISTERLINLVNDMLNISRIESGRVGILPKVFDIQTFASDIILEFGVRVKEKNLNLKIIHSEVPNVFADPDKVHQIVLNLIGNAVKFTPSGGTITLSFFSDGHNVDMAVKDSGVGIAEEDLPRLFKKFGRLDNSYVAAATSGGTGLGLYISKSLVELMGGRIWAKSEGTNKGSSFIFSLPAATKSVLANKQSYVRQAQGEAKILEPVAI